MQVIDTLQMLCATYSNLCTGIRWHVHVPGIGTASSMAGEGTCWNQSQNEELVLSHHSFIAAAAAVGCSEGQVNAVGICVYCEMAEQSQRCFPYLSVFLIHVARVYSNSSFFCQHLCFCCINEMNLEINVSVLLKSCWLFSYRKLCPKKNPKNKL